MVLMILLAAGTIDTTGFGDSSHRLTTSSLPGIQVLVFIAFAVGSLACSLSTLSITVDVLDQHDLGLDLFLILQLSSQITSLAIPGSPFIFTDSESILILLVGLVTVYVLVISAVELNSYALTDVSVGLTPMWALVALTNLCVAGIAIGFGDSRQTYHFPGHSGGCIWRWFHSLLPSDDNEMSHLDLLTPERSEMLFYTSGFSFIISGLCMSKFDIRFRVAAGWSKKHDLGQRLFRLDIIGLGPTRVGYGPLFLGLNSLWTTALKIVLENHFWSMKN